MTSTLQRLRAGVRAWKVRRRRRKLLNAYSKVFRVKHAKGPGLSPILASYDYAIRDGHLDLTEDGTEIWHWPEGTEDVYGHMHATARWFRDRD